MLLTVSNCTTRLELTKQGRRFFRCVVQGENLYKFLGDGPPLVVVSYGSLGPMVYSKKLAVSVPLVSRDAVVPRVVIISGNARLDVLLGS